MDCFWKFFALNKRLFYLNREGGFVEFRGNTAHPIELDGDILQDRNYGNPNNRMRLFWNLTANQVFIYLNKACYKVELSREDRLYTRLITSGFDFESNKIISVYYDVLQERLFLGSFTKGLFVLTRQQFRTLNTGIPYEDEVYYGQAARGDSAVITPNGMIFNTNGVIATLPLLKKKNIPRDDYSVVIDKQGNIWHKNNRVLRKFNSMGTKLLWEWECPGRINVLYVGKDNRLWIGTRKAGLYYLSTTASVPAVLQVAQRPHFISWLQEAQKRLWIGTMEGLYSLEISTGSLDSIPAFDRMYIRSLNLDHPGELWVTTYDDGFFLYRNNKLIRFPLDRDQYLATAHCMVEDSKGYYWITTNKGLFQVYRQDLLAYANKEQPHVYYHYYGKDRGFHTNEFNGGCQPCAIELDDGYISLPSIDGLVLFSPERIYPELPDGPLHIDYMELDKQPLACHDTLCLPHGFRQLKLYVSTPYFGDSYNLQMSYALIRHERDTVWLPLANGYTLALSTLPSGTYRLLIRKIDGFGDNNYTQKELLVTVEPAYYETTGFRVVLVLLLIAGVIIYIRLHTYQIKQQNLRLESHVSARTTELQSTMAALALSEKKLRRQTSIQERLLASITHDIRTPIKYLVMLAGNMSWKEQHELEPETVIQSSKAIYDTSYRMYYLVGNLVEYLRMHVRNENPVNERFDLHELLEEKIDIFGSIARSHGTQIVNDVLPDTQLSCNYQVLAVVLHNLLDNAVKQTSNGIIRLYTSAGNGRLMIIIEDSGPGLPLTLLHWINNYQYDTGEEGWPSSHGGMGLIIVLELLELVNGKLTAENKPGKGAVMSITLLTYEQ